MLVSSSNDSLFPPHHPSTNLYPSELYCFIALPNSSIFLTFYTINIITVLPLCIFILCFGLKQWRRQGSSSSAATVSHSDCFTYNMVVIELIGIFNCVSICCGIYLKDLNFLGANTVQITFVWHGQTLLHLLTCVERYLAVVHPVFYLSFRTERGIRVRNVSMGSVWLLCSISMGFAVIKKTLVIIDLCVIILTLASVSFCSISILLILVRPKPGKHEGDRERVDQSKQRALYTIVIIFGVLIVRFAWCLVWAVIIVSEENGQCVMMLCAVLFDLPTSLVLPLLFLHRKGKLVCRKNCMR